MCHRTFCLVDYSTTQRMTYINTDGLSDSATYVGSWGWLRCRIGRRDWRFVTLFCFASRVWSW